MLNSNKINIVNHYFMILLGKENIKFYKIKILFINRYVTCTANPVGGKACSSTKGGLLRYIVNSYSIHKISSF